jgi:hypothetical protein
MYHSEDNPCRVFVYLLVRSHSHQALQITLLDLLSGVVEFSRIGGASVLSNMEVRYLMVLVFHKLIMI